MTLHIPTIEELSEVTGADEEQLRRESQAVSGDSEEDGEGQ